MIKITKEEAELIHRVDPTVFIAVTGRHKNARSKRRYVSEDIDVMRLLKHNADAVAIVDAYDRRMRYLAWRKRAGRG